MAMGHVTLKEFYVDREVPYFRDYARRYTDMPMLVSLREREDGSVVADSFLRSSDLGDAGENAEWKTVVYDATPRRGGRSQRLDRLSLGRGGRRAVEPRPGGRRPGTDPARASLTSWSR